MGLVLDRVVSLDCSDLVVVEEFELDREFCMEVFDTNRLENLWIMWMEFEQYPSDDFNRLAYDLVRHLWNMWKTKNAKSKSLVHPTHLFSNHRSEPSRIFLFSTVDGRPLSHSFPQCFDLGNRFSQISIQSQLYQPAQQNLLTQVFHEQHSFVPQEPQRVPSGDYAKALCLEQQ